MSRAFFLLSCLFLFSCLLQAVAAKFTQQDYQRILYRNFKALSPAQFHAVINEGGPRAAAMPLCQVIEVNKTAGVWKDDLTLSVPLGLDDDNMTVTDTSGFVFHEKDNVNTADYTLDQSLSGAILSGTCHCELTISGNYSLVAGPLTNQETIMLTATTTKVASNNSVWIEINGIKIAEYPCCGFPAYKTGDVIAMTLNIPGNTATNGSYMPLCFTNMTATADLGTGETTSLAFVYKGSSTGLSTAAIVIIIIVVIVIVVAVIAVIAFVLIRRRKSSYTAL